MLSLLVLLRLRGGKKKRDVELELQVGQWCGSSLQTNSTAGLSRKGFFLCTELQGDLFLKVVFFVLQRFLNFFSLKGEGRGMCGSYNRNAAFLGYPVKGAYQNVVWRTDGLKALKEWNWRV